MDAPPGEARARRGRGNAKSPSGDSSRRRIRGRALALAIALTLHKYLVAPSRWFSISLRPLRSLRLNPLKEDRQREVVCAKFAHTIATLGINLQNLQIIQNSH